jgi:glycosyltransferase involved in cell wall biosynthesis
MAQPLFSIVTVVYNGKDSLGTTFESVFSQGFKDFEYIVVDGASTDGTVDIIKKNESQIASWISEPDHGIYDAMNKGISLSRGKWILFLNSGDRFYDGHVLSSFLASGFDQADIVYGDAMIEYPGFDVKYPIQPLEQMWKRMPFCHQAMFCKTDVMRAFQFDTQYRLSADFDVIYRAFLQGMRFVYFERMVCLFNNKAGASIRNMALSVKERRDIVLKSQFSWRRWAYYKALIFYIQSTIIVRKLIGQNTSQWITKFLRHRK